MFKLARSWRELNRLISTLLGSVMSVGYLSLILLLFMFIFALLGMQLFGYKFQFCDAVEGSQQLCPPGMEINADCPDHLDCYLPCDASQVRACQSAMVASVQLPCVMSYCAMLALAWQHPEAVQVSHQ